MKDKNLKLRKKFFDKKQKASEGDYQLNVWKFLNDGNIFRRIGGFFNKVKYARDRARKGFCDYDLCDLDIFFVDLIIRALEEHKESALGYSDSKYSTFEDWTNAIDEGIGHFKKYKYLLDDNNNVYYLGYIQAIEDGNTDRKIIRDKFDVESQKMYEEAESELRLGFEFLAENLIHLCW